MMHPKDEELTARVIAVAKRLDHAFTITRPGKPAILAVAAEIVRMSEREGRDGDGE